jgi:hypothetical protein
MSVRLGYQQPVNLLIKLPVLQAVAKRAKQPDHDPQSASQDAEDQVEDMACLLAAHFKHYCVSAHV